MPLFYFHTVSPNDYDEVVGFQLSFAVGDYRVCHNVTIYDDNQCEQRAESFLSRLSYVSGEMPITIDPEEVRVFINDDYEPECGECALFYILRYPGPWHKLTECGMKCLINL